MLSLKSVTTSETKLMVATMVDWHNHILTKNLEKQLKKAVKKHVKLANLATNRINTFMVLTADLKEEPALDDRKAAEVEIRKVLTKYSEQLNSGYRKQVVYNGDSDIYYAAFKEQKLDLKQEFFNRKHGLIDDIEVQIERIISTASLMIWDAQGTEHDRIILPGIVATLDVANLSQEQIDNLPEIADLLDELIIANFSGYFLPFTEDILRHTLVGINQLAWVLDQQPNYGKLSINTERALRNFIGSISGVQESLKLLRRIVTKLIHVYGEIAHELAEFPSAELHNWLGELQEIDGETLLSAIDTLDTKIFEVKPQLRLLLKGDGITVDEMESLFHPIIEVKAISSALVQFTNQFTDIPSFTTMTDGIAFESVEDEQYHKSDHSSLLEGTRLFKLYRRGGSTVYALRGVDITIQEGDFVVIQGPSGSGKTTLLNMLAGIDSPNRGTVFFKDIDLNGKLSDRKKSKLRRENYSFIFQSYALIQHLDATENVALPIDMGGLSKELKKGIQQLLDDVGIGQYADHKPAQLSGGQMQRLGIARALANKPSIIFADEPTGDLDENTGRQVMELLKKYHDETGVTIVLVTHNPEIASYGTRAIYVDDGQIIKQEQI